MEFPIALARLGTGIVAHVPRNIRTLLRDDRVVSSEEHMVNIQVSEDSRMNKGDENMCHTSEKVLPKASIGQTLPSSGECSTSAPLHGLQE